MPQLLAAPLLPAGILTAIFIVLSLLHWYWAFGGTRVLEAAIPTCEGKPLFKPGRVATVLVAIALLAAAVICLWRAGVLEVGARWLAEIATWVLVGVFVLRAIGDFRYCGFSKRVRDTAFARNDTRYFSPLCVVIALLTTWLALVA